MILPRVSSRSLMNGAAPFPMPSLSFVLSIVFTTIDREPCLSSKHPPGPLWQEVVFIPNRLHSARRVGLYCIALHFALYSASLYRWSNGTFAFAVDPKSQREVLGFLTTPRHRLTRHDRSPLQSIRGRQFRALLSGSCRGPIRARKEGEESCGWRRGTVRVVVGSCCEVRYGTVRHGRARHHARRRFRSVRRTSE